MTAGNPELSPADDVDELADRMASATDTMRAILEETLASADDGQIMESGRTVCGTDDVERPPLGRFPESVELQTCPVGIGGVWHSHVSTNELLDPEHSLPDVANVALGHVDVSVVAGTETADVLVGAADRDVMADEFRHVLGLDVETTDDVVAAIRSGRVQDPTRARSRVREALGPLFRTVQTGYGDLTQRARTNPAIPAAAPVACSHHADEAAGPVDADDAGDVALEGADAAAMQQAAPLTDVPERLRRDAREASHTIQDLTGSVSIKEQVVGTTIGLVVGRIVERAVFGD